MASLVLLPSAQAVGNDGSCTLPNNDTTPPFTDMCYHQGVWYSPDTAEFDVLVLPPTSPYELREWQLLEQSVANWEAGIRAMGAPWMAGLHINDYMVGREPVPASALSDPEVIVAVHANVVPLGMYAGAASLPASICHGVGLPEDSDGTWHSHDASLGHYMAACEGGGRVCVVTDAATLGTPTATDARVNFDLVSHEIGHCLTLGHVGDANTESTDDSLAYPEHDIMSYENDGLHAATMHCPSNLNVLTIEKAFGALLGRPGATTATAPQAAAYIHMKPGDWNAPACVQSTASYTDVGYAAAADPLGLAAQDDADGDGVPDADDACPGSDDRIDTDGDGVPEGCDADDNDGPLGDQDGDGVRNADDQCPGIDDASPACQGTDGRTLYFGRGALASPSGNVDVAWGDDAFLQLSLKLKPEAPTAEEPAVLLTTGVDGVAAHNVFYEPGEWSTDSAFELNGADVEVVWWAVQAATGTVLPPTWDVALYFDGATFPAAAADGVEFPDLLGATPSEYRLTFADVTGSGRLSVVIDPTYVEAEDSAILYDGIDHPSRLVIGPDDVRDSDGDGVPDDLDACPGSDDRLDLDADAIPDGCDGDRDGDGVANGDDWSPDDPSEWADTDGDGVGDNADACPGSDDAADWDGDGTPDGCDSSPDITITSPTQGEQVQGDLTVTGTTPGTAGFTGPAGSQVRLPAVLGLDGLDHLGLVHEPWMESLESTLRGLPGYHGLFGVAGEEANTLHLVADGPAAAIEPKLPAGWLLERHAYPAAAPLGTQVTQDQAFALPDLPRGGVLTQGLGPGTPLYMQYDGNTLSVGICTANYLWKDQDGALWLGAAGHCFLPEGVTNADGSYDFTRTDVYACRSDCALGGLAGAQAFFEWQAGAPLDFVRLGEVGYARQQGVGQDFGVVGIPAALYTDLEPETPGLGGPYGVNPNGYLGDVYSVHGNGLLVGETVATKSRFGLGDGDGGDKTSWAMVGLSNGGDSGSAVNSLSLGNGIPVGPNVPQARGLLTHGYADPVTGLLPTIPISFGTTVAQAIAMATEGGLCLELVMASEDPVTRPAAQTTPACEAGTAPDQVLGVEATPGDGEVALSWLAPADNGQPITGYTVRYGADGVLDQQASASGTSLVVTGLQNGVAYTFTVAASNSRGEGAPSAPVAATPQRPIVFTVQLSVDGGDWSGVAAYDEDSEAWQASVPALAVGAHRIEARLLHLGVERARTSVDVVVPEPDPDGDADGVPDGADNCPAVANADQADLDADGIGNACDDDRDGDGYSNDEETAAGSDPDDASSVPQAPCEPRGNGNGNGKKDKCRKD